MQTQQSRSAAVRIFSCFGIDVRLHLSVIIIFTLIVVSLGQGVLPAWHPEWTPAMQWSAAALAGILFFASLLAHELAHSLVARNRGLTTSSITLFLFGGVAAIEAEPARPQDELWIAAAGPAMSLALSGLFAFVLMWVDSAALSTTPPSTAVEVAELSFIGTVALWLASINMMLALFNLIPGFPMDGGRLFRAALWWRTGDIVQATRKASRVGNLFGWLLMLGGVYYLFRGAVADGIWLLMIGWFIDQLASASIRQLLIDRGLASLNVATIMRTRFDKVPHTATLDDFVENYMLRSSQQIWPVAGSTSDIGYISVNDLPTTTDRSRRAQVAITDCMNPLTQATTLTPEDNAKTAFQQIALTHMPVPVVAGSQVVGLLDHRDALRWLSSHLDSEDAALLVQPGEPAGARS